MKTLYDLLGALPNDGAEGLRTAFRRAVKGAHPDIHPDDPDAAMKFRQIVHANDILTDDEQRAAYDHLLKLAHLENEQMSRHNVAVRTRRLVSGVMALAGACLVTTGGFLLFTHVSAASIAAAYSADVGARRSAATAALLVTSDTRVSNVSSARGDNSALPASAIAPPAAVGLADAGSLPTARVALDADAIGDRFFQARGIYVGSPGGAIADFDLAIDQKLLPAYVDRSIIFYRPQNLPHAFGQPAPTKRMKTVAGFKSPSTTARKPEVDQIASAPAATLWQQTRTAAQDPSRLGGGVASAAPR